MNPISRILLALILPVLCLSQTQARDLFGYVPSDTEPIEMYSHGTGERRSNCHMECAVLFDPATDPAWASRSGSNITDIRVWLNNEYKQKSKGWSYVTVRVGSLDAEPVALVKYNFKPGWNEVELTTPVAIGDEPIYIGARVFETLSTLNPFASWRYGHGASQCYLRVIGNETGEWQSFDDRGSLLLQAVTDASSTAGSGLVTLSDHNGIVKPGEPFESRLHLINRTSASVSSATVHIIGEGVDQILDLNFAEPVEPMEHGICTVAVDAPTESGINVPLQLTAVRLDGKQTDALSPVTHSLYVSGEDYVRIPLVEEFTSLMCVNCPNMYYYLEQALDKYRTDDEKPVIYLGRHAGFVDDAFTVPADHALLYLFGDGYTYNPAMMIDRTCFDNATVPVMGASQASLDPYLESIRYAATIPAPAELFVEPVNDIDGRRLGARVYGTVNSATRQHMDSVRLSVYLVENDIPLTWYPQTFPDGTPASIIDEYRHNGVIRAVYSDKTGDLVEVDDNGQFFVEYPYIAVDDEIETSNAELVAVLHRTDRKVLRNNSVLNATSSKYVSDDGSGGILTGIETLTPDDNSNNITFAIDPNGMIIPSAPIQSMQVFDLYGRMRSLRTPLAPGLYMVSYRDASGHPGSDKLIVK